MRVIVLYYIISIFIADLRIFIKGGFSNILLIVDWISICLITFNLFNFLNPAQSPTFSVDFAETLNN